MLWPAFQAWFQPRTYCYVKVFFTLLCTRITLKKDMQVFWSITIVAVRNEKFLWYIFSVKQELKTKFYISIYFYLVVWHVLWILPLLCNIFVSSIISFIIICLIILHIIIKQIFLHILYILIIYFYISLMTSFSLTDSHYKTLKILNLPTKLTEKQSKS